MGNDFSKGVDSAVSIITGIITGDMTGGLAGASAPWLAEQIKIQAGDNETARLVAHAILGAVVAELQGNSALSGGAGAVAGEVAADIIRKQLYGKEVKDLTEEEKQTISALSQLASGLAVAAGGGNIGDASTAISSSKNAVENNYLNSDEHQTKKGLEYKERKGILTDEEKMELLELRLKDDSLSDALINACIDVNSDECHVERQKAYDALKTYKYLTYSNPPNAQIGYQEIEHLLNSTSSAANEFRAIYNGYVVSFKSFGYSDEEAQVMAGRTIAIMMMINGLEGHFALPMINRALKGSKLSTANESKTSNITGKLDKDYFESVYGKENVQQGGGNYKEIKDNINNNQAANQQANKNSNFDKHVVNEKGLENAGKGTTVKISPENQKYVDILSPEAKQHILYGDSLTSGGHLYPGNPGKTIFPKNWSADKVVHEIGDIATSPNTQWYAQTGTGGIYTGKGKPANWVSYEVRDGVRIRVVYQPANGKIITAFPDNAPIPNSYKPIK